LAGTYFYNTYCSSCATATVEEEPVNETVVAPVTQEATSYPFAFSDGDFAVNENDNYNFNLSSSAFLTPLSQTLADGIAKLKAHLGANTDKAINITGYYKGDETNNSAFPNLGLARANAVKNDLVANGIDSRQINTMGKLMDDLLSKEGVCLGPIEFGLSDLVNNDDEMKALFDKINADKVAGATCTATGHTDSQGPAATNQVLGQERADFAKSYLISNGIASSKINAASKGESQPIADNMVAAGRAKNRRTVVTLNN